ncbi:MAG TPA: sigma-70 family RNA polymerase sigma factor [Polyangiaceae bacterium]|nr:sigma-70 family RNA polymerase sigma factor [Polyangiaceae bacterium]
MSVGPARDVSAERTVGEEERRHTDIELMRFAAAGQRAAQRIVMLRLMRRIQRLCRSLLRHAEDARDASQASLFAILRSAANFRGESSLERWADRIAIRTTLRQFREKRHDSFDSTEDACLLVVQASADPGIAASQYLDLLPERQRTALILRCGFEYSVEEIAEITRTSPNTVKDRLKRGRENLRRAVGRDELLPMRAGQRPK